MPCTSFPRKFAAGLAVFAALAGPGHFAAAEDGASQCVIQQNFYYPRAGNEEEALATRLKANQIRVALGVPAGRVLRAAQPGAENNGPGGAFYLTSQVEFENRAAADRYAEILAGSAEFAAVRGHMQTLLEKFETVTWSPEWGGCSPDTP